MLITNLQQMGVYNLFKSKHEKQGKELWIMKGEQERGSNGRRWKEGRLLWMVLAVFHGMMRKQKRDFAFFGVVLRKVLMKIIDKSSHWCGCTQDVNLCPILLKIISWNKVKEAKNQQKSPSFQLAFFNRKLRETRAVYQVLRMGQWIQSGVIRERYEESPRKNRKQSIKRGKLSPNLNIEFDCKVNGVNQCGKGKQDSVVIPMLMCDAVSVSVWGEGVKGRSSDVRVDCFCTKVHMRGQLGRCVASKRVLGEESVFEGQVNRTGHLSHLDKYSQSDLTFILRRLQIRKTRICRNKHISMVKKAERSQSKKAAPKAKATKAAPKAKAVKAVPAPVAATPAPVVAAPTPAPAASSPAKAAKPAKAPKAPKAKPAKAAKKAVAKKPKAPKAAKAAAKPETPKTKAIAKKSPKSSAKKSPKSSAKKSPKSSAKKSSGKK